MRQRAADIRIEGVGKAFGNFWALRNVSLDIARGEFLTLLGPSGSGKTTLLMILAGFEQPSAGRIFSAGEDLVAQSAEARQFGMVFQGYALFPHMTAAENIAFPLQVRKLPRATVKRRVAEMIERVGLKGHEHKPPAKLSGGQQQRVALARALVFEPPALLLDEPFSALDKHLRGRMQEEVKRLHEEFGTTFIFVTHDQSEALSLSSRIAIFNHGAALQVGAPRDVYERPANRFVAEFLGEINLLPVENVGVCARGLCGTFEGVELVGPGERGARRDRVLAVRPEHMAISRERPEADANGVVASVASTTYLGAAMRLGLVTRGGARLNVTLPPESAQRALNGEREFWITWPMNKGFLLPDEAAEPPAAGVDA